MSTYKFGMYKDIQCGIVSNDKKLEEVWVNYNQLLYNHILEYHLAV